MMCLLEGLEDQKSTWSFFGPKVQSGKVSVVALLVGLFGTSSK